MFLPIANARSSSLMRSASWGWNNTSLTSEYWLVLRYKVVNNTYRQDAQAVKFQEDYLPRTVVEVQDIQL